MVTEVCILKIDPQKSEAFEQMYKDVVYSLRKQIGYQSDRLMHANERPEEYVLAVEWNSIQDHQNFINSPDYPIMADGFGRFVLDSGFAHYFTVAHSEPVKSGA